LCCSPRLQNFDAYCHNLPHLHHLCWWSSLFQLLMDCSQEPISHQ
jgi:hypothetical protein